MVWRWGPARAQVCFIIRDMIRGTKMFKDYGQKIPIDKWVDAMGNLLKDRRMTNALQSAMEGEGEEPEDDE